MGMRPITRTNDEVVKEAIEETARRTAKAIMEQANSNAGSRISQILKNANKIQTAPPHEEAKVNNGAARPEYGTPEYRPEYKLQEYKQPEHMQPEYSEHPEHRQEYPPEKKEKPQEEKKEEKKEDDILCPTCHTGHVHILKTTSGKLKCEGEGCGIEYNLIPDDADYKCRSCGAPKKKPLKPSDDDNCPFCNGKEFIPFNWAKLKNKTKK